MVYNFMDRFFCAHCGKQPDDMQFGGIKDLSQLTRDKFPISATAKCHGESETRTLTWQDMGSTQHFFSGEEYHSTGSVVVR